MKTSNPLSPPLLNLDAMNLSDGIYRLVVELSHAHSVPEGTVLACLSTAYTSNWIFHVHAFTPLRFIIPINTAEKSNSLVDDLLRGMELVRPLVTNAYDDRRNSPDWFPSLIGSDPITDRAYDSLNLSFEQGLSARSGENPSFICNAYAFSPLAFCSRSDSYQPKIKNVNLRAINQLMREPRGSLMLTAPFLHIACTDVWNLIRCLNSKNKRSSSCYHPAILPANVPPKPPSPILNSDNKLWLDFIENLIRIYTDTDEMDRWLLDENLSRVLKTLCNKLTRNNNPDGYNIGAEYTLSMFVNFALWHHLMCGKSSEISKSTVAAARDFSKWVLDSHAYVVNDAVSSLK